jgi:hypothetical protein
MMERGTVLWTVVMGAHAALGGVALLGGASALATRKGSSIHRRGGLAFAGSLLLAVLFAIPAIVTRSNVFLGALAPFVILMAFRGWHSARLRREAAASWAPRAGLVLTICASGGGVVLLAMGAYRIADGAPLAGFPTAMIVLGLLATRFSWSMRPGIQRTKSSLLVDHAVAMIGAYTAAVTAFVAVNFPQDVYSPAFVWGAPPVLGALLIRWWRGRLRADRVQLDRGRQGSASSTTT